MHEFFKEYLSLILLLLNGFFGWLCWSFNKKYASKTDVELLDKRLVRVERVLESAPTVEMIHDLNLALERLSGKISNQEGILLRTEKVLQRQEEYLLNVRISGGAR